MAPALTLAYLLLNIADAPQPITHCLDLEGRPHFMDRPCPRNAIPILWSPQPSNVIAFAPLPPSPSSQPSPHFTAPKIATPNKRRNKHRTLDRKKACRQTRSELKALRAERRRGYRLSKAAELDMKMEQLKSDKRKAC